MTTSNELVPSNLDLDRLMAELDVGTDGFPEGALRTAQAHRDLVLPRLIDVLRSAAAAAREGDPPKGNAHLFALFLLAEFRAREAMPAILEALSLEGELPLELFGEVITEDLGPILASIVDSPEVLDDLIRNRELNESVRWEAARAYLHLVRDGRLTRDEVVERLRERLRDAIVHADVEIVGGLICELISYSPAEAREEIRDAFRRGLVDDFMVTLEEVEESIAEGDVGFQAALAQCQPTGVEDAVAELKEWWEFNKPLSSVPSRVDDDLDDIDLFDEVNDVADMETWDAPSTIRNTRVRVGRNAPCPCGSGKKFKKCCGVPE